MKFEKYTAITDKTVTVEALQFLIPEEGTVWAADELAEVLGDKRVKVDNNTVFIRDTSISNWMRIQHGDVLVQYPGGPDEEGFLMATSKYIFDLIFELFTETVEPKAPAQKKPRAPRTTKTTKAADK